MNYALIFAGGTGARMNTKTRPKQFLEVYGKDIIIYTLEHFENHRDIDGIVVVCLKEWMDYLKKIVNKNGLQKVKWIVEGGTTGQESIFHGIQKLASEVPLDSTILVHDGVRPIIDEDLITRNIKSVKENGSGITVVPVVETIVMENEEHYVTDIYERSKCMLAKAPQSFVLGEIYKAHQQAIEEGKNDFIDSASIMKNYGYKLATVKGSSENIKITNPVDYYLLKAILDAKENSQIFG